MSAFFVGLGVFIALGTGLFAVIAAVEGDMDDAGTWLLAAAIGCCLVAAALAARSVA